MAEIALSSVQTVLDALDFFEVKRIRSFVAYKSQIKDLRRTVTTIKNILKDAESSKEFTNKLHLQGYIQQLRDVIYEADDLFDEFVTQVELGKLSESDTFFAKLPHDFSKLEKLIHLNLANCKKLTELPHDFGKLEKLIHLNLANCKKLTELPHDFRKLVKLSHLILDGCKELTGMPLGLDRLKKIGALTSLVGRIDIEVGESCNNVEVMKELSGEYLSKIPGLKEVNIYMKFDDAQAAEAALEKLEPHPNLKELSIGSYGGRTIPWWRSSAKDELAPLIQLSNLVSIQINNCGNLVNLPSFSKLPFLNSLSVGRLNNLEYMETRSSSPGANDTTFFPSLLNLRIRGCSKLKGWFREEGLGDADCGCWGILSFPRLSYLLI